MEIQEQLEILLPTYNRKEHLTRTLTQLTASESPMRDFSITVLDNASTDGTAELVQEFTLKFPNITHIRHKENIGGNANIARAFELGKASGKEYVWVICDDDEYDFAGWEVCKAALEQHPGAVVVANYAKPERGAAALFKQLSFVPAAIYRTDLITGDVLQNMYFNISNMFPQLAVAAALFNSGKEYIILPRPLVTMKLNTGNDSYVRGSTGRTWLHPHMKNMFWGLGYLNSLQLLQDKKVRACCCWLAGTEEESFYNYCGRFMSLAKASPVVYAQGVSGSCGWAKLCFALFAPCAWVCSFYQDEKGVNIRLFGKIKIRIWFQKAK